MRAEYVDLTESQYLYFLISDCYYNGVSEIDNIKSILDDSRRVENLCWLSHGHNVSVDLYVKLKYLGLLSNLPKTERDYLEGYHYLAVEDHKVGKQIVSELIEISNTIEYPLILIKGSALLFGNYYEVDGIRHFADIDILVPLNYVDEYISLLEKHGYYFEINVPRKVSGYFKSNHLPFIFNEKYKYFIECHTEPFLKVIRNKTRLSCDEIDRHSQFVYTEYGKVKIPCPEHMLLHAFYNSQVYDRYPIKGIDSYKSMLDAVNIVRAKKEFDWDMVTHHLKKSKNVDNFSLYVNRISLCVDSTASRWPVQKKSVFLKTKIFELKQKNPEIGFLHDAIVAAYRGLYEAIANSKERKIFRLANPNVEEFESLKGKLIKPSYWLATFCYFVKKTRIR